jgi:alpha-galactosidase
MWGGWYYALDFYKKEVREYLAGVFHVVCEQWGYEILKLDFLFAVALQPPPGKTRGQVMYEAMEFMRQLAGEKSILGCGVPLGACFGLVDYCRIGGDIHTSWEHGLLQFLRHRERVSTLTSLRSTLGRWLLNGRAFHNDPDVFILRTKEQKLNPAQQHTVLIINTLLGNLLFTSDDVAAYSAEQMSELEEAIDLFGSRIFQVSEALRDVYRIEFETTEKLRYHAFCNMNPKAIQLSLENGNWLALEAFETIVLRPPGTTVLI